MKRDHRQQFTMPEQPKEFDERVIAIDRVSRTVAGGRRMRFRALVLVGNRNGKIGMGVGKAREVITAIQKATRQAKKHLQVIPIVNDTIPLNIDFHYGSTNIYLKSAPTGTSVIAGGLIRDIMELGGVKNVVAKIIGSTNKINNAKATLMALQKLNKHYEQNHPVQTGKAA